MPKYKVLEPLGYDRWPPYMPGEVVGMEEGEAAELVKSGVLGPPLPEKTRRKELEA
jgi:hypothetical protein